LSAGFFYGCLERLAMTGDKGVRPLYSRSYQLNV